MQEEIPLFVPRSHLVLPFLVTLDFSESSRRLLSSWKEEKLNVHYLSQMQQWMASQGHLTEAVFSACSYQQFHEFHLAGH